MESRFEQLLKSGFNESEVTYGDYSRYNDDSYHDSYHDCYNDSYHDSYSDTHYDDERGGADY